MYESKAARKCMESIVGHNRSSPQNQHVSPLGDEVQVTLTEEEAANNSEQEESFNSNQGSDRPSNNLGEFLGQIPYEKR